MSKTLKRLLILIAFLIVCIVAALCMPDMQNPYKLQGWYKCTESEDYGEDVYLILGTNIFAIIDNKQESKILSLPKLIQFGTYKASDESKPNEYTAIGTKWNNSSFVYHKLKRTIDFSAYKKDKFITNIMFKKPLVKPEIKLPIDIK